MQSCVLFSLVLATMAGCAPTGATKSTSHPLAPIVGKTKAEAIKSLEGLGFERGPSGMVFKVDKADFKSWISVDLEGDPVKGIRLPSDRFKSKFPVNETNAVRVDDSDLWIMNGGPSVVFLEEAQGFFFFSFRLPGSLSGPSKSSLDGALLSKVLGSDINQVRSMFGPVTDAGGSATSLSLFFGSQGPSVEAVSVNISPEGKAMSFGLTIAKGKGKTVAEVARALNLKLVGGKTVVDPQYQDRTTPVTLGKMKGELHVGAGRVMLKF